MSGKMNGTAGIPGGGVAHNMPVKTDMELFEYKNFECRVHYNGSSYKGEAEQGILVEAEDMEGLEKAFHEAVDAYLAEKEARGEKAESGNMKQILIGVAAVAVFVILVWVVLPMF